MKAYIKDPVYAFRAEPCCPGTEGPGEAESFLYELLYDLKETHPNLIGENMLPIFGGEWIIYHPLTGIFTKCSDKQFRRMYEVRKE